MKTQKWRKHKLSEVADLCLGKMLDKKKNKGELHPYLGNIHVRWGRFNLEDLPEMRFEKHEHDRYGLKCGDLVVCEGGEPGRCALWKGQVPGMKIQKALHRVRPHKSLDGNYLLYWFLHAGERNYFDQYSTGATIKHLSGEKLAKIEIDLPDLPTQKKIAGILSAYDDLIENNLRRIAILEEMAQSLYREWFVHFRIPSEVLTQAGLPAELKLVDSELGKIPEGWEVGRLDDALVLQRGFDLPKRLRKEGTVPIYAASGITAMHSESKVKAPGVVTGRSGTLGRVMYVQEDFWPLNTALWVKEFRRATPLYAFYLLQALDLAQFNSGAAVPTLNRNDVHGLPVVLPDVHVLEKFERLASNLQSSKVLHQRKNENLRKTRDLLLPKLLNSKAASLKK